MAKFIDQDGITITGPLRVEGLLTIAGGMDPEIELGNIDSLDISGSVTAAGSGNFGNALTVAAGGMSVAYDSNTLVFDDTGLNCSVGASVASLTVVDTVTVGGAADLTSLALSGDLAINSDKFTVAAASGNTSIAGTLGVTGNFAIATNKFQVTAASGNTSVAGTLGVTGAATCSSTLAVSGVSTLHNTTVIGTLSVSSTSTLAGVTCTTLAPSGNVAVNTDKFTVTASNGNTAVGGTLAVTGATTLAAASSTALTASTSLTVTGASIVGLTEHVTLDVATLVGAGATVYGLPSPVAGTVVKIQSWLKGALTTGDATLTSKIGNTGITNGVITITQSGSARGDVDVANPTAANTVAVGSNLNITVGGTNDAAVGATVVFTILRSA